ncbi:MAG: HAD-IC family P-type ATPase [Armatimonadetes bacterium]|nr:HAD-IC family P-type ATPase [Gemmatimonadales bacterium]NIO75916.1 HAD-IC family P-type ATPase [Armatimonadota bacterium]
MTKTDPQHQTASLPMKPWAQAAGKVLEDIGVSPETGLTANEVRRRRRRHGVNALPEARRMSVWAVLLNQFRSLVVLLLVAAALVAFAFGEWVDGIAIAAVVVINAAIGFATEIRAARSMEALRRLGRQSATVRRNGAVRVVPAWALVPGDIAILEAGDVIAADLRLVEASNLQLDESTLTGESVPVTKQVEDIAEGTPLAERSNMAFKGTAITQGTGEAVVVAVGVNTELGRVATLAEETHEQATPLERRLDQLGQRLVWVTLVIAALVLTAGLLRGRDLLLIIETAIALAVATIPEGLPIVATAALARGMLRMARRNALINRLSAVETLGATNIICTDKTGTLTENRMSVSLFALPDGDVEVTGAALARQGKFHRDGRAVNVEDEPLLRSALEIGVLCNGASLDLDAEKDEDRAVGDPMEVALLVAGEKAGLRRPNVVEEMSEAKEHAFDPDLKMMATAHESEGGYRVAVKGAPEAVLEVCSNAAGSQGDNDFDRERWLGRNKDLAEDGLRVLALAEKTVQSPEDEPYRDLLFVGLVGLRDPAREEVRRPIGAAQSAGIRIVMVTGDQAATARNVAHSLGLRDEGDADVIMGDEIRPVEELSEEERRRFTEARIFARVSPEQKLHLVDLYQSNHAIVAMTGDGVNDAPALKKADIGIAMGRRGTQVAREASDMVLLDDAFATIVHAVEQGRVIFRNLRRFVFYLLSCNVAEVMIVGLASIVNAPLPILPLQILFLNLVTDVFPALALGMGKGEPAIMDHPPRDPREPILTSRHWKGVGGYGAGIAAAVLGALALSLLWLHIDTPRAVTVSFLTLAFAQLWHVFNMRDAASGILRNDVVSNTYVWGALSLCLVLLLGALYIPFLAHVLKVVPPDAAGWSVILGMSALPLIGGQVGKLVLARRSAQLSQ